MTLKEINKQFPIGAPVIVAPPNEPPLRTKTRSGFVQMGNDFAVLVEGREGLARLGWITAAPVEIDEAARASAVRMALDHLAKVREHADAATALLRRVFPAAQEVSRGG